MPKPEVSSRRKAICVSSCGYFLAQHIKSVFAIGFLLVALGCLETRAQTFGTVTMGGGGYVDGVIACPTQTNLFYCKTDVGGAYRWDETNQAWIPLLDWCSESQTTYQGAESLAIDPSAPQNLYIFAGTSYWNGGASAILRSTNYGATFAITDTSAQFKASGNGSNRQKGEELAVDPNKGTILFCGSRANGLFKSTDSGVTWAAVASLNASLNVASDSISFVQFDKTTGTSGNPTQRIFVGVMRTNANFFVSNDAGATWTSLSGSPVNVMPQRCALANNNYLYITYLAGTTNGAVMKYNTTNGVWADCSPGGARPYCGISLCATNPLKVVTASYGLFKHQPWGPYGDLIYASANGGTNWVDIFTGNLASQDINGYVWIAGSSIHWAGGLEMDPFNPNRVFVGSGNGLFCTTNLNSGLTSSSWKFQVKGLEETVPINFISVPGGPFITSIGDYGGLVHTNVAVPALTDNISQSTSFAYAAKQSNFIARVVYNGELYYAKQTPVTWTKFPSTPGVMTNGAVAISADGSTVLWKSTSCYVTTNMGTNWTASVGLTFSCNPEADAVNSLKFYAYNSSDGFIYASTDGGLNFAKSGSVGTGGSTTFCTAPGFEGHIWVALNNGGLKYSINSGTNFSSDNVSVCNALAFGKAAPGASYPTLYIWGKPTSGSVSGMYRSTDQGTNWIRVNDDSHEYGGRGNAGLIEGDKNVYGRVFMSTVGRGVPYMDSASMGPAAPTGLAAVLTSSNSVALSWVASQYNYSYNVKLGTNSGGPFTIIASNILTASYGTAFSNSTVYYVVSAVNETGVESPDSVPATVTIYSSTLVNYSFETNTSGTVFVAKTQSSQGFDVVGNDLAGWLNAGSTYVNSGVDFNGDNGSITHNGNVFAYCDAGDSGAYQVVGGYQMQAGDQITLTWWAKSSFSTPSQSVQLLSSVNPVSAYSALTLLTNYASTFGSGSHAGAYTQFTVNYTAKAGDAGKYPAVAFMVTGTANSFANFDDFNLTILSIPAAPTALTATAGNGQVVLNWNATPKATGYNVKQSQTSGGGGPYIVIASNISGLALTNTELVNGNTYYYVVSATNAAGESANSMQVSAVPLPPMPPPPTGLIASANAGSVNLKWNAATNATGYNIYRSLTSGVFGTPFDSTSAYSSTNYTDTSVNPGTTYYYSVTAINLAGESSPSGLANATTPPPASPVIGQVSLSGGNLIFSGDNGTPGMDYLVLMTTNLSLSASNWSVLTTNTFDAGGNFNFTNPVNPASPQQFYQIKLP